MTARFNKLSKAITCSTKAVSLSPPPAPLSAGVVVRPGMFQLLRQYLHRLHPPRVPHKKSRRRRAYATHRKNKLPHASRLPFTCRQTGNVAWMRRRQKTVCAICRSEFVPAAVPGSAAACKGIHAIFGHSRVNCRHGPGSIGTCAWPWRTARGKNRLRGNRRRGSAQSSFRFPWQIWKISHESSCRSPQPRLPHRLAAAPAATFHKHGNRRHGAAAHTFPSKRSGRGGKHAFADQTCFSCRFAGGNGKLLRAVCVFFLCGALAQARYGLCGLGRCCPLRGGLLGGAGVHLFRGQQLSPCRPHAVSRSALRIGCANGGAWVLPALRWRPALHLSAASPQGRQQSHTAQPGPA